MTDALRIATWNLQRPVQRSRRERIAAKLRSLDADVWVLTETIADLSPGAGYRSVLSAETDRDGHPNEAWVAVWSRHPITPLEVLGDRARTAAALVAFPGKPVVVFGSVLPWRGSRWGGHASAGAAAFGAALAAQQRDWARLTGDHGEVCVAGDFNQDLSGKPYYWSKRTRTLLQASLDSVGLRCTTAEPDPVRGLTDGAKASIDHICIPKHWSSSAPEAWDMGSGRNRLSDHYGVCIGATPQ